MIINQNIYSSKAFVYYENTNEINKGYEIIECPLVSTKKRRHYYIT